MNILGKRRQQVRDARDYAARLTALERQQDYIQEQIKYGFLQLEKKLGESGKTEA